MRDLTSTGKTLFLPTSRPAINALSGSLIRQIANAGMGRSDIAAFWFGESDLPTPRFIREAAERSLADNGTFYTENLGLPALRDAVAGYSSDLHGRPVSANRIAVTGSGVSGLMLASQLLVSPGDKIVVVTPVWPNIAEIPTILGAQVVRFPLSIRNGRWSLDVERLLDVLGTDTRMLVINSPNNPTGWTSTADDQRRILEHCRCHGIWILSDEVYERLIFRGSETVAPSMLSIAEAEDRLIVVNSFSKAWRMTGWRVGWLTVPAALEQNLATVVEYNTSCVADFVQRGALAAIVDSRGEEAVADLRTGLERSRALLLAGLDTIGGMNVPVADGAMYAFFSVDGHADSLALAMKLLDDVGLGLAPGRAFGTEGEGWLRWCYAASPAKIADGLDRLQRFMDRQ